MKKKKNAFYTLLICLVASSLSAQDMHERYVNIGDDLLEELVGKTNFNDYFLLDETSSYYEFETKDGEVEQADFNQKLPAKARFLCYHLYYLLDIPAVGYSNSLALYISCDSKNNLPKITPLIPQFMVNGDPPNLISKEEAELIAVGQGYKIGRNDWVFDLDFNEKYKKIAWGIYNMVEDENSSTADKKWNAIEIDAVTGQILHTYKYVADF